MTTAPIRYYRQKPLTPVVREKLNRSIKEAEFLSERELRCPHCDWILSTVYSDISGHLKIKCPKCKELSTLNLRLFRRRAKYRKR